MLCRFQALAVLAREFLLFIATGKMDGSGARAAGEGVRLWRTCESFGGARTSEPRADEKIGILSCANGKNWITGNSRGERAKVLSNGHYTLKDTCCQGKNLIRGRDPCELRVENVT